MNSHSVDKILQSEQKFLRSCNTKTPYIDIETMPRERQPSLEEKIRSIIKDIQNPSDESKQPEEITFYIYVEIGSDVTINQEYLISSTYDTLSLIGNIGGTLGVFFGFSFYNTFAMIIDFFAKKFRKWKQNSNQRKSIPMKHKIHPKIEKSNSLPNLRQRTNSAQ